jgi:hypothetical protein
MAENKAVLAFRKRKVHGRTSHGAKLWLFDLEKQYYTELLLSLLLAGRPVHHVVVKAQVNSSLDLHDNFGFNRRVIGERSDTDGGAGVLAAFAPNFDEQIGRAIDYLRHFGETGSNIYEAEQFDEPLYAIEIAHSRLDDRQMVQGAMAGHLISLFEGYFIAYLASIGMRLTVEPAGVAADEQKIADLNVGNVMSRR